MGAVLLLLGELYEVPLKYQPQKVSYQLDYSHVITYVDCFIT